MPDEELKLMSEGMLDLVQSWKAKGINTVHIVAFMMRSAADTAEYAGVDYEVAKGVIDQSYGRANIIRPTVKA